MNFKIIKKITNPIEDRINRVERHLIFIGIVFTMLAFLVAGTDFMVRFLVGTIVLVIAYLCFYFAFKIREIKREIFRHFK